MNEARDKSRWGGLATVLVVALLNAYVGGYFGLGNHQAKRFSHVRWFESDTLRAAYEPLAWIESKIRGVPVLVGYRYLPVRIYEIEQSD